MLILFTNNSPNGENRHCVQAVGSVILAFGCNHIKSAPKMEKAASKTRKRLELYKANLKEVTFVLFFLNEFGTGGKCWGIWICLSNSLPLLFWSTTGLDGPCGGVMGARDCTPQKKSQFSKVKDYKAKQKKPQIKYMTLWDRSDKKTAQRYSKI